MGLVYADVELINGYDLESARRYIIGEEEIKRMHVNILVDSGSIMLAINERIQEQWQLPIVEKGIMQLANGRIEEYDIVSKVELRFKNRRTMCNAVVLPGDTEPLLGTIPLEDMDVLIHTTRNELIIHPDHPYFAQMKLK
jgi:clan AA aspartic protease